MPTCSLRTESKKETESLQRKLQDTESMHASSVQTCMQLETEHDQALRDERRSKDALIAEKSRYMLRFAGVTRA